VKAAGGGSTAEGSAHAERTALAWRRTGASFFVVGLALAKTVISRSDPLVLVIGCAALVTAMAAALVAHSRQTMPDPGMSNGVYPGLTSAAVVLVGAAATFDILLEWVR
jgi:uncharacterized membrane protein YidH (DUF202 family)